jgi:ATP-dependent Zn protease
MRNSEHDAMIAHHEAGHATIARVLGIGMTHVTMFPTTDNQLAGAQMWSAGYLARNADWATRRAAMEKDVLVSLAGPLAQHRHRPAGKGREFGGASDREYAQCGAATIVFLEKPGGPPDAKTCELEPEDAAKANQLLGQLCDEAKVLVDEHWSAIARVAEALLVHRVLGESDVDDLIAGRILRMASLSA